MAKYVIDIDESDYETIKAVDELGGNWNTDIAGRNMRAIANATPFEKVVEDITRKPLIKYEIDIDELDYIKAEFVAKYPKNYAGEPELGGRTCYFSLHEVLEILNRHTSGKE